MELRRRTHWALLLLLLPVATVNLVLATLQDDWSDRLPRLLTAAWPLTPALALLWMQLQPFRFRIDERGLTIRNRAYEITPAWSEIEMVILDLSPPTFGMFGARRPQARLLLVPAPGADLGVPLTGRTPLTEQPCAEVLDFAWVSDKPEAAAAMLGLLGGDRFVDGRLLLREVFVPPAFTRRPLGYDRAHVDEVIRRGRDMLASTVWHARREIATELLPPHPIARDGYDRAQVDRFTRRLSAAIATLPGVPPPPD